MDEDGRPQREHWCASCKKPCEAEAQDVGIGAYEFWGAPGNDSRTAEVSDCCEAELLEHDPNEEEEEP